MALTDLDAWIPQAIPFAQRARPPLPAWRGGASRAADGQGQKPAPVVLHEDRVAQRAQVLVLVQLRVRRVGRVEDQLLLVPPALPARVANGVEQRPPLQRVLGVGVVPRAEHAIVGQERQRAGVHLSVAMAVSPARWIKAHQQPTLLLQ